MALLGLLVKSRNYPADRCHVKFILCMRGGRREAGKREGE